jgi:hypothetical protein
MGASAVDDGADDIREKQRGGEEKKSERAREKLFFCAGVGKRGALISDAGTNRKKYHKQRKRRERGAVYFFPHIIDVFIVRLKRSSSA